MTLEKIRRVVLSTTTKKRAGRGFFSLFTCLLPLLEQYEKNHIPLYVDWSGTSNYVDPRRGGNFFDYFFEQPFISELTPGKYEIVEETDGVELFDSFYEVSPSSSAYGFHPSTRSKAVHLISKYIKIKNNILAKLEAFKQKNNFRPRQIGI